MINRSQRYLDEVYNFNVNFSYHSYRNNSIDSYVPAAEELTKLGYYVIRMGHLVGVKIKHQINKSLITTI